MDQPYYVLAYYFFTEIADAHEEIRLHKSFFEGRDVTSRIYINETGINGQMSAAKVDAEAYMEWMKSRPLFANMTFKIHYWHEQVFPRQVVKYRNQLVAYDLPTDLSESGEHVSPKKWREMLEKEDDKILIDVRNDYEWKLGHFEGADLPQCNTFREFDQYAEELHERVDPKKTPVMMYCTGGIRCELYSAALKKRGFKKVYQLDGGIINYGLQEGSEHWLGKLFVFDDRMSVPISNEETPVVAKCYFCNKPSESYYNCANMDCNELYICCQDCLQAFKGCCSHECGKAGRVRPYHQQNPHKPFRKRHTYQLPHQPATTPQ
jgi:UPF0176 protein